MQKRAQHSPSRWSGVFPAMITPMHRDESLDLPALQRHIETMLAAGVQGIVVLGSLGENLSLTPDEKLAVIDCAVPTVRGRVPLLAGVIETSTAAACRFAEAAARRGVDGLMLLPAMVYRADPRETLRHFRRVARATELPIVCYNNPLSYHVDITPSMFADLADEPRFVAIKESS
ncbi:MAG: dihydrodipicolinate synthase family protein, partial [Steroidobacteraceae bacterium]|nr:dihydrodipicolinate synthase family protein [Steroidobacteraceae bacterium]MDW8258075.1 dihydrodipicolinate synthase family protein [Gammaproteobacteria bacterium]